MYKHELFEKLPKAYIPSPEYGHHPPTLIFGFPISRDLREFRRIAFTEGLLSAEECEAPRSFASLRLSVLGHLNDQCGLKPGGKIIGTGVDSLSTNFILEVRTNYRQRIPNDKVDEVMQVLQKYLPETELGWYLEANIDQKRIHASPSEFLMTRGRDEEADSRVPVSLFEWTKPPGISFTYSDVIALNELFPFRT